MRVEERKRRNRLRRHSMVVHHDDVHPSLLRALDSSVVARATVAGHQEPGPPLEAPVERLVAQAVAAAKTICDQRYRVPAEHLKDLGENEGRRRSINVVVSEHDHALAVTNRPAESLGGNTSVRHGVGWRESPQSRTEKALRVIDIANAPMKQYLSRGRSDPAGSGQHCRGSLVGRQHLRAWNRWPNARVERRVGRLHR